MSSNVTEIVCLPKLREPLNGAVNCSNFNNIGSSCGYSCRNGFVLLGRNASVCAPDSNRDLHGRWTELLIPECQGNVDNSSNYIYSIGYQIFNFEP